METLAQASREGEGPGQREADTETIVYWPQAALGKLSSSPGLRIDLFVP